MDVGIGNDNPILSYKLDPGEMGIAVPSTAMLSIEHVAGHETGNAARARASAIANGGYVIYSAITLDMRKRGMFLAAVAGKTTVKVYYPRGKGNLMKSKSDVETPTRDVEMRLEGALNILKGRLSSEKNVNVKENIKRRISEIRNALVMLKMGRIFLYSVESLVDVYV